VSLDPPYISFCPARASKSWPLMREIGTLCVNILAHDQHHLCTQFAVSAADKFGGVPWRPAANGAPLIDGAVATIEASVEFEHGAGDHTIVVAQVTGLHASNERHPLLFYRGSYGAFA
jgi:flavin reductase (DIM6/NTAB) family NADH-FMN oxidoreductase RutF